jgi:hypothetical protein
MTAKIIPITPKTMQPIRSSMQQQHLLTFKPMVFRYFYFFELIWRQTLLDLILNDAHSNYNIQSSFHQTLLKKVCVVCTT